MEEIKRRLFGGEKSIRQDFSIKREKKTCECAFLSTYPHRHFRISFSEETLGLKFREGRIVRLRENTESKYDVRTGDFIHMVNDKNVNLFREGKEDLDVDRRILKYFMQYQERPLEIEFIRFETQDHHPKVVTKIDTVSPVVIKTRPKRSWSQTKTTLRRRASSEDRFQIRKSELLEEARLHRTKWIKSEWEDVVPKISHRQRHDRVGKEKKMGDENVEEQSALDIMDSLVTALHSDDENLDEDECSQDVNTPDEQHLEDLMNAALNLLDSISSPDLKDSEKETRQLDEDEAWFLDLIKHDAAASIVASAQRFISTSALSLHIFKPDITRKTELLTHNNNKHHCNTHRQTIPNTGTAIAEIEQRHFTIGTNESNSDIGRVKSFSDISSSVLNLDDDDSGVDEKKTKVCVNTHTHTHRRARHSYSNTNTLSNTRLQRQKRNTLQTKFANTQNIFRSVSTLLLCRSPVVMRRRKRCGVRRERISYD